MCYTYISKARDNNHSEREVMSKAEAKYTWRSFDREVIDVGTDSFKRRIRAYLDTGSLMCRWGLDDEWDIQATKGGFKVQRDGDSWTVWECVRDDSNPGTWEALSTPGGRVIKFADISRAKRFTTLMIEDRV